MTIKHLVISGGGATGMITYGAAAQLAREKFWQLADIKSIYGCSIGAYIGFIISLGCDWDWLDDYFIKRPWNKLVAASTISLIDVYEEKSLLNEQFFTEAIVPFLKAKDLNETATLENLYDLTHIELHMYSVNINSSKLEKVDISHKTHPHLTIIKALRMTMAFPIIFQPVFEGEACYIDGGVLNNFPLNDCLAQQTLAQHKAEKDEILAFKNIWTVNKNCISEKSSILDFLLMIMKKTQASLDTEPEQEEVKHTVRCLVEDLNDVSKWIETLSNEETRHKFVEKGKVHANLFLSYIKP